MRLYRLNLVKSPVRVETAEASSILARVILKCTESDNKSGQFRGWAIVRPCHKTRQNRFCAVWPHFTEQTDAPKTRQSPIIKSALF